MTKKSRVRSHVTPPGGRDPWTMVEGVPARGARRLRRASPRGGGRLDAQDPLGSHAGHCTRVRAVHADRHGVHLGAAGAHLYFPPTGRFPLTRAVGHCTNPVSMRRYLTTAPACTHDVLEHAARASATTAPVAHHASLRDERDAEHRRARPAVPLRYPPGSDRTPPRAVATVGKEDQTMKVAADTHYRVVRFDRWSGVELGRDQRTRLSTLSWRAAAVFAHRLPARQRPIRPASVQQDASRDDPAPAHAAPARAQHDGRRRYRGEG